MKVSVQNIHHSGSDYGLKCIIEHGLDPGQSWVRHALEADKLFAL